MTTSEVHTHRHHYRENPLTIVLGIIGLAILALGLIYFIYPARDLPAFVPGHITRHVRHNNHYTKRAWACVVASAIVFIAAYMNSNLRRRLRHRS